MRATYIPGSAPHAVLLGPIDLVTSLLTALQHDEYGHFGYQD